MVADFFQSLFFNLADGFGGNIKLVPYFPQCVPFTAVQLIAVIDDSQPFN